MCKKHGCIGCIGEKYMVATKEWTKMNTGING